MDRQRFYEARSKVLNGEHVRAGIGTYGEKTVHAVLKIILNPLRTAMKAESGALWRI